MARQRRGGGFRPPELRGTLGTLLNTALQQAGVVRDAARDVLERGAREGRSRLDDARSNRRRQDALAELGELVLDLIRRGEIDLAELPEAKPLVRRLDELDDDHPDEPDEDVARAPSRSRFDVRDREDGTVSSSRWSPPKRATPATPRVWRPTAEPPPEAPVPARRAMPRNPHNKGGIAFDDDDDLAEYMHPDDVPPKPPTDGEA
jgi:hypothetical protein